MPITKSAKKAIRQSAKKRKFNLNRLEGMRIAVKAIKKLKTENLPAQAGKKAEALKELALAYKAIDKAAKRGVIKKGAADRKKSRLAKMLAK